ncbi:hypothetical protein FAZ19_09990 [Sphingobacterium alkalisoli]|uniref:Terminase small subunit n=1 Tax=Sphingobacterium alkalisoli TaxID=1874115 RepID=A0A4U0H2Z6_9SPHI|nr:hypothetical protein FAZ19_09990 [Sphingobacterium alkalisoli]GGH20304.1 hypothetical protein GCM10011418_25390 [Sphingobacterium alkalisoli]
MLTSKQKRFCDKYLVGLNAIQSAIRASYRTDSWGCDNGQIDNFSTQITFAGKVAEKEKKSLRLKT